MPIAIKILIESQWNLKPYFPDVNLINYYILIESQWNLKFFGFLVRSCIPRILIESQWNLKFDSPTSLESLTGY